MEAFIVSDIMNGNSLEYCGKPVFGIKEYNFDTGKNLIILGNSEFYHEEIRGYMKEKNIQLYPQEISAIPYNDLLYLFQTNA